MDDVLSWTSMQKKVTLSALGNGRAEVFLGCKRLTQCSIGRKSTTTTPQNDEDLYRFAEVSSWLREKQA